MKYAKGTEIAFVNLVRSCQVKGLVHVILYDCCRLMVSDLFHGVVLENGTVEKLSPEDLERCIIGRDKLCAAYETLVEALWSFSSKCDRGTTCRAERITVFKQVRQEIGRQDPLRSISHILAKKMPKCSACTRYVETKYNQARGTIWNQLRDTFGIVESRSPSPT
jgi:hypothetical protein